MSYTIKYIPPDKKWPPQISSVVMIKKPNREEIFIGRVTKLLWNSTAALCTLLNNTDYVEKVMLGLKNVPANFRSGKGIMLLLPNYDWDVVDEMQLGELLQGVQEGDIVGSVEDIKKEVLQKYTKFTQHLDPAVDPESTVEHGPEQITTIYPSLIENPHGQVVLQSLGSDTPDEPKSLSRPTHIELAETIYDSKEGSTGVEGLHEKPILTENDEPDLDKLFDDPVLQFERIAVPQIDPIIGQQLQNTLLNNHPIQKDEMIIPSSKALVLDTLIKSQNEEELVADKMVDWLMSDLSRDPLFSGVGGAGLESNLHDGYVYITRRGVDSRDYITHDLLEKPLLYLRYQYGKPIDYTTLKYILFQNKFQKTLEQDTQIQEEATNILSQEYLVALQPEPQYQMWCVKRLIKCWYADPTLYQHIRKIKILVNQYRANNDNSYNLKHGILPSVVIYPKYGIDSAKLVMRKLGEYFFYYKTTGWSSSTPSYFIQVDRLIYYTNGLLDLKQYFRNAIHHSKGSVKNEGIYTPKYTRFERTTDPFNLK